MIPTKPNFSSETIFVSNAGTSDGVKKAWDTRRGDGSSLRAFDDGAPPIGLSGKMHPLTEDAEHKTDIAKSIDDVDAHQTASLAHEKAANRMAEYMKQTGPRASKNYKSESASLKAALQHHKARAQAHDDRAGYLENEMEPDEKEKKQRTRERFTRKKK